MNGLAKHWPRWNSQIIKPLPYLCCLLFVVWEIVTLGLKSILSFASPRTNNEGLCELDSFSAPSVASGILKQQAEQLLMAYSRDRQVMTTVDRTRNVQVGEKASIQKLETLQHEVSEMDADLDRKLMIIYFDNHSYRQFLDRYLHLIDSEPQSANVLNWAWPALTCSKACARTEEVFAGLENLVRFHPELKTARGLELLLKEWNSTRANQGPAESSVRPQPGVRCHDAWNLGPGQMTDSNFVVAGDNRAETIVAVIARSRIVGRVLY